MRMKEICEKSGLTEKAVRLYIKEGLVLPEVRSGIHNQSYHFSGEDLTRLRDIAALRQAGFGLADIKEMQQNPEKIPSLLSEHAALLSEEIAQKQAVKSALDRLSVGAQGTMSGAAEALRPTVERQPEPKKSSGVGFKVAGVILSVLCILLLLFGGKYTPFAGSQGNQQAALLLSIFLTACTPILSGFCGVMGIRYLTCVGRARKLPCKGTGTVVQVIEQTGFDSAFASLGTGSTTGAGGGRESGQGGVWQIWFMTWNEIRPDRWFPLIQYQDETGRLRAATYPYGWLKNTWQEGETPEIAWKAYNPQKDLRRDNKIYPLHAPWLVKKGIVYLTVALAGIPLTVVFWNWFAASVF